MKKIFTAILLSLAITSTWAADETITFSEKGFSNEEEITNISGTSFTITFNKGTNIIPPRYYTSGTAIRAYGGNYFTIASTSKTITKIEITFGSGDGTNAITTDVGSYSNGTWTGSAKSVKFTVGGTSGNRRLSAIAVTYEATPSTPTVTGIAAFKGVEAGTTVQLYLPDDYNARVTHVEAGNGGTVDAYVRDNTGAMRMTGISPNRAMAYNQHLAGWITGKYTVGNDGIPQFQHIDGLTNTDQLVIADPVTEATTHPTEIDYSELDNNLANWVKVNEMEVTGSNVNANKFNLSYTDQAYEGAIVDISAIAANGTLYPVDDLNRSPITHVIDSEKTFTTPNADIANTDVRLKRQLRSSQWQVLTLPFDIDEFDGDVMQYTGVEQGDVTTYNAQGTPITITGGVMKFTPTDGSMQAGVPYLVRPNSSTAASTTFNGVTLSKNAASTVTKSITTTQGAMGLMATGSPAWAGDYSLVGTYEPTTLAASNSTAVITSDNQLSWTSLAGDRDVAATGGYITMPSGAGTMLDLGTSGGTITAISTVTTHPIQPTETIIYNLMGQRLTRPLSELPPGIYIVNGKKIVKQ